jgi:hypothetical protein
VRAENRGALDCSSLLEGPSKRIGRLQSGGSAEVLRLWAASSNLFRIAQAPTKRQFLARLRVAHAVISHCPVAFDPDPVVSGNADCRRHLVVPRGLRAAENVRAPDRE